TAGAGHPDHVTSAVAALQLAGQQVVGAPGAAAAGVLRVLFHLAHLLDLEKERVADDAGDTPFDANIPVNIDSPVALVVQNGSEAAFVPTGAFFCFDAAGVQVVQYIREGFIVRDPAVDLPDDFSLGLIHDDAAVRAAFQAEGQAAVALALAGIVH